VPLLVKDWKVLFRNRILLVVLIVYPFLIMGVMGAVFQESGRPVPVGMVNLDGLERDAPLFLVCLTDEPARLERMVRLRAESYADFSSAQEALQALEQGIVGLAACVRDAGKEERWWGATVDSERWSALVAEVESECRKIGYAACLEDTLLYGGEDDAGFVLALRAGDYPYMGESIWLEGEGLDARDLLERYSAGVTDARWYQTEGAARADLRRGRLDAVMVFPPAFVHRLKTLEEVARIPVVIDQSNLVKAEFAETGIRGFLSRVSEEVVREKMDAVVAGLYVLVTGGDFFGTQVVGLGQIRDNLLRIEEALAGREDLRGTVREGIDLADTVINDIEEAADYLRGTALPVELEVTSVAGRPLGAKDAVVPSLIALSMLWTGVLCGAILMVLEDQEGMRARLRLTSMGSLALVGSKLVLAGTVVFLQSAVMLLLATAAFGTFASNLPLALLVIAVSSFSCIGMGLVLAAFARQVAGAVLLCVLVSFPLMFLTGAIFPLSEMPAVMRGVAHAVPLTYTIKALSGVMLRGQGAASVAGELLVLLASGCLLLAAGSLLVRRRTA